MGKVMLKDVLLSLFLLKLEKSLGSSMQTQSPRGIIQKHTDVVIPEFTDDVKLKFQQFVFKYGVPLLSRLDVCIKYMLKYRRMWDETKRKIEEARSTGEQVLKEHKIEPSDPMDISLTSINEFVRITDFLSQLADYLSNKFHFAQSPRRYEGEEKPPFLEIEYPAQQLAENADIVAEILKGCEKAIHTINPYGRTFGRRVKIAGETATVEDAASIVKEVWDAVIEVLQPIAAAYREVDRFVKLLEGRRRFSEEEVVERKGRLVWHNVGWGDEGDSSHGLIYTKMP